MDLQEKQPLRIDGKKVQAEVLANLKVQIDKDLEAGLRPACLAVVIVGEDAASQVYVRSKVKACEKIGIKSSEYRLPATVSEEDLLDLIDVLNSAESVDGILCQLPLPKHIRETKVLDAISPLKDVDGFHPENIGLLLQGRPRYKSCTPLGIMTLLKAYNVELKGKEVLIIGRSNIVGKPLAALMLAADATVTIVHSRSQNIDELARRADVLVVACGRPKLIDEKYIKEGAIVIDVGIHRMDNGKLCGDVDFERVSAHCSAITPVPGGVGPMTIASLMENTYSAYKLHLSM